MVDTNSNPPLEIPEKHKAGLATLQSWSANGTSAAMEAQMLNDVFVLNDLAILGQWTVFYAASNTGKTLLTIWLIREQIATGDIDGADVFYVNADDGYKGEITKLKIAETTGFTMLLPNKNGFNPKELLMTIFAMIQNDEAKGKVIILDTLKKFTDLMDKKISSEFGRLARQFVSAGGTIICLAHVNKHKTSDGKSVHAGTTDIKDDADCVYVMDVLTRDKKPISNTEIVTVIFRNEKSRGAVADKALFSYTKQPGCTYEELLNSVTRLSDGQADVIKQRAAQMHQKEIDRDIIESVKRLLNLQEYPVTELAKKVYEDCHSPIRKVNACIKRWAIPEAEGGLWVISKGENNSKIVSMHKKKRRIFTK